MSWKKLQPLEDETLLAGGVDLNLGAEWFYNPTYLVDRRAAVDGADEIVRADDLDEPLWLIVRRLDGQPARDWRHLQRIKNQLAGEDREALELFPDERRLVDVSNVTHLWVLRRGQRIPFGFQQRVVQDSGARPDVVQRPLDDDGDATVRVRTPGRNEPCHCGSGKKFKRCCGS